MAAAVRVGDTLGLGGRDAARDMIDSGCRKAQEHSDTVADDLRTARERGRQDAQAAREHAEDRGEDVPAGADPGDHAVTGPDRRAAPAGWDVRERPARIPDPLACARTGPPHGPRTGVSGGRVLPRTGRVARHSHRRGWDRADLPTTLLGRE